MIRGENTGKTVKGVQPEEVAKRHDTASGRTLARTWDVTIGAHTIIATRQKQHDKRRKQREDRGGSAVRDSPGGGEET